jgi:hypothetical protein
MDSPCHGASTGMVLGSRGAWDRAKRREDEGGEPSPHCPPSNTPGYGGPRALSRPRLCVAALLRAGACRLLCVGGGEVRRRRVSGPVWGGGGGEGWGVDEHTSPLFSHVARTRFPVLSERTHWADARGAGRCRWCGPGPKVREEQEGCPPSGPPDTHTLFPPCAQPRNPMGPAPAPPSPARTQQSTLQSRACAHTRAAPP